MEGETGILQQRVKPLPVRCRRIDPRKGVGGEKQEGIEAEADRRLPPKGRHMRLAPQGPSEKGDGGPRHAQDGDPKQQRPLMIEIGSASRKARGVQDESYSVGAV